MAKRTPGSCGISNEAVLEKTGKSWQEWFEILNKHGMKEKGHTQTAKHKREKHRLSPWWAQVITILYEYEGGFRTDT